MKKTIKWLLIIAVALVVGWNVKSFAEVYDSPHSSERGSTPAGKPERIYWPKTLDKFAGLEGWEMVMDGNNPIYFHDRNLLDETLGAFFVEHPTHPGASENVVMQIYYGKRTIDEVLPTLLQYTKYPKGRLSGQCLSGTTFRYYTEAKVFHPRATVHSSKLGDVVYGTYRVKDVPYNQLFDTVVLFRSAKHDALVKVAFAHPEGVPFLYKICQEIDPLLDRLLSSSANVDDLKKALVEHFKH